MTSPTRAAGSRRPRRSGIRVGGGMIAVFGAIASILLVFTDNLQYIRVGLVAALWAAAVGALAMTKYRRELVVEGAKARDLQTVYRLQLEREVTARREYELGVEARVRQDLRLDVEEIVGLRADLTALRKSLDRLLQSEFGMSRPAVRADSTRVVELPAVRVPQNGLVHPAGPRPAYGRPPQPMFSGTTAPSPAFASPYDRPVTAETSHVSRGAEPGGADGRELDAESTVQWAPGELGSWPAPDPVRDEWETAPHEPWSDADWTENTVADDGSHSQGLSVAQIMANLRSEAGRFPAHPHRRDYDA